MVSPEKLMCGIILVTVPTIASGGAFLLRILTRAREMQARNSLREALFRAGHAHAGVLVLFSLIFQVLLDGIHYSPALIWTMRCGPPSAAILMPLGFFLSVLSPTAEHPNRFICLVYVGGTILGLSTLTAGILLLRSSVS